MKQLSIPNKMVRTTFFVCSILALMALSINHFTNTASLHEYIVLPVLVVGFFYISLTNKIDFRIDGRYLRYQWLSIKKREIMLSQINEVYLGKHKIIIRTQEKDIKLDIFNAGRKYKEQIREFLKLNLNVPVTLLS